MDNNLINIDDLVRQRLSGGEEQERSGAWLRMRDLLDQEMPKKRVVGMYWRRMLGALAVILLISMLTVGGYEMSSLRKNLSGNNTIASSVVAPTTNAPQNGNQVSEVNNTQVSSSVNTDDNETKTNNTSNKQGHKLAATENKKTTSSHTANKPSDKKELLASNDNNKPAVKHEQANKVDTKETAIETAFAAKTANNPVVTKDVAANTAPVKTVAAKTAENNKPGKTKEVKTDGQKVAAVSKDAHKAVAKNTVKEQKISAVSKDAHKAIAKNTVKEQKVEALPLGSKAPSAVSGKAAATAGKPVPADKAKMDKLALATKAPAAKGVPPTVVADKVIDPKGKDVATTAATKAGKIAAAGTTPGAVTKPVVENKASKEATAANMKKGKRIVQKLVLLERYIKISPNEGYYHLDTISMEEVTEEMGLASENKPYLPLGAKKPSGVASANGSSDDNTTSADAQILPGATANANGKPAMGTKETATGKKSGGASVLQNLSNAFNDIKVQASGAKFAAGLTGGINGTFFGPSSFKGFQFGVTGDFMFDGNWSIGTALEYFHRINGSYSLYDNYASYTQVPGGYNKQQESYSYSIATLHSVELPIAARYASGNFNFFVGANLVYDFAINTGGAPDLAGSTQFVTTQGNDNHRTVSESDFNSRFGVGCLFGVSYQVNQNVNVDLRNVLTLWDNSNSAGAKYVSEQLYRSPSIQLSLGYRFNGNKKNK